MSFRDLAFAVRTLRRTPFFTLAVTLTIALGLGATIAIFAVVNAVLLRPLPYEDPDRLVLVYADLRNRANYGLAFSTEDFIDLRNGTTEAFDGVAAVTTSRDVILGDDGSPELVTFARVTTNVFDVLGVRMALGRNFMEADGQPQPLPPEAAVVTPGAQAAPPVPTLVILSHDYWQRRFGGSPTVLGRTLGGGAARGQQIVGVLAPGVELLFPPADNVDSKPDVWVASRLTYDNANRTNRAVLRPIARLKPGVTLARAQAQVESVAAAARKSFPVHRTAGFSERLEPMHETMVKPARPAILTLMGAAIFLLLIACANVANLILVRTSARQGEIAVRGALGAGRPRLVGQMLSEALVLTGLGTAAGIVLAWIGISELLALAPPNLPRLDAVRIDPVVLAATVGTAVLVACVFAMAPAVGAFRSDVASVLRANGRTGTQRGGAVLRNVVVVAQVALCFVLLIGSGLMLRSFVALQRIDPGFRPDGVLTFRLLGNSIGRGPRAPRAAYVREIESRLRSIPGVQSVAASFPFPLTGNFTTLRWGTADALADNTKYQAVDFQLVRPGYFETLGTPLIEGRTFAEADDDPSRNLVIIDEVLAAKAFGRESAVGKRILVRSRLPEAEWLEVIGVVGHQRVQALAEPGREQLYLATTFIGMAPPNWALRVAGDPAGYAGAVRAELARFDRQLLVTDVEPMTSLVRRAQASMRFSLTLIAAFALVAALLVAIGLYGVLSTIVRQRTAEIGVRVALGAEPTSILRLVLGHGLRLSVAGIALGFIAAIPLTRLMTTMLVGVKPTDPATIAAMSVVFFTLAIVSCWLPARRAAALDPVAALRQE